MSKSDRAIKLMDRITDIIDIHLDTIESKSELDGFDVGTLGKFMEMLEKTSRAHREREIVRAKQLASLTDAEFSEYIKQLIPAVLTEHSEVPSPEGETK